MTKQEIIDTFYVLVHQHRGANNRNGNVYKPIRMLDIPEEIINVLVDSYIKKQFICSNGWWRNNYDAGEWDAFLVTHKTNKGMDVFICSLLIRPFSETAQNEHEKRGLFSTINRLMMPFDSRIFDAGKSNPKIKVNT